MNDVVRVREVPAEPVKGGPRWAPVLGQEFSRYLAQPEVSPARERLEYETPRILQKMSIPHVDERIATLVLGYVQSGKTGSFTGCAALAHDNGYQCVIVIGGVTTTLLNQTYDRLTRDLSLETPEVAARWQRIKNPKPDTAEAEALINRLVQLEDDLHAGRSRSWGVPIIFVMKQKTNLNNLRVVLETARGRSTRGLSRLSTLMIDDEAHMHTPNIQQRAEADPSAIYAAIKGIRAQFPSHSLLQYTATPQANLLASLADEFSPDYVKLLDAGEDYAGGKAFFIDQPEQIIRVVPLDEISAALEAGVADPPPQSLQRAFASYLLICASNLSQHRRGLAKQQTLSMLVHADGTNRVQQVFEMWITALRDTWRAVLSHPASSVDRQELVDDFFRSAHTDLVATAPDQIVGLEVALTEVPSVLGQVQVITVNQAAHRGAQIIAKMNLSPYNVLNGGNVLGVGFTVPGLVVTHMMRKPGGEQIDTVQQRGRFFGYRKHLLPITRVWLQERVRELFTDYVTHEEHLRLQLQQYDHENRSLREWKRQFRLDPLAKLCRKNAIFLDLNRFSLEGNWFRPRWALLDEPSREANLERVRELFARQGEYADIQPFVPVADPLLNGLNVPDDEDDLLAGQPHLVSKMSVERLLHLLVDFHVHQQESAAFEVVLGLLRDHVQPDQVVDVFRMWGPGPEGERKRKLYGAGTFQMFQGKNPKRGPVTYLGDAAVHGAEISIQVSLIRHKSPDGHVLDAVAPYVAVYLPEEVQRHVRDLVIQGLS